MDDTSSGGVYTSFMPESSVDISIVLAKGGQALCALLLMVNLAPAASAPPHPPVSPQSPGQSRVVLQWDYPQPSPPIDGFLVQRRMDTGMPWQEVGRVGATTRMFTDTAAPRNTPVCYQVRAYHGQEQSSASNEVCLTIPTATPPPARPRPGGRVPRRHTAS